MLAGRIPKASAEVDVTYRAAVGVGNQLAELRYRMKPAAATAADAYARFLAVYGAADPMSLEIEIWHGGRYRRDAAAYRSLRRVV